MLQDELSVVDEKVVLLSFDFTALDNKLAKFILLPEVKTLELNSPVNCTPSNFVHKSNARSSCEAIFISRSKAGSQLRAVKLGGGCGAAVQ